VTRAGERQNKLSDWLCQKKQTNKLMWKIKIKALDCNKSPFPLSYFKK
jgi:hypothetical protein